MRTDDFVSFMNDRTLDTTHDASAFIEELEKSVYHSPLKNPVDEEKDIKRSSSGVAYDNSKKLADILNTFSDSQIDRIGSKQARNLGVGVLLENIMSEIETKNINLQNPPEEYKGKLAELEDYLLNNTKYMTLNLKRESWNNLIQNINTTKPSKYQPLSLVEAKLLGKDKLDAKIKTLREKIAKGTPSNIPIGKSKTTKS